LCYEQNCDLDDPYVSSPAGEYECVITIHTTIQCMKNKNPGVRDFIKYGYNNYDSY